MLILVLIWIIVEAKAEPNKYKLCNKDIKKYSLNWCNIRIKINDWRNKLTD